MADIFEQFTVEARRALEHAADEARRHDHTYIGTEHLLVGLLAEPSGVAGEVFAELGLGVEGVRQLIVFIVGRGMPSKQAMGPLTPRAKAALAASVAAARDHEGAQVGTEHLLLGLLRDDASLGTQILHQLGVGPDDLRRAVERRISRN